MKTISFKTLTIKNFLSVGDEEITIDFTNGLNVITGFNRDEDDIKNGVGKSTILNAFYFAIFGDTMQDLPNKSFIVNRKNGKNCKVILTFHDKSSKFGSEEFIIERGLAPQVLKVMKNGMDKTKSTIPETNKYIKEVLSASEDIFSNCIIMRANNNVPFMNKKKGEKKSFIENMFNLSIFSDMLKLLREDLKMTKHDYDIQNNSFTHISNNVDNYKVELERIDKDIEQYNSNIAETKRTITEAIEVEENNIKINKGKTEIDFNARKEELEKKVQEGKAWQSKLTELYCTLSSKLHHKQSALKNIQEDWICPTCKRPLDKDIDCSPEKIKEITDTIDLISSKIKEVDDKAEEIRINLVNNEYELKQIQRANQDAIIAKQLIEASERSIRVYKTQLEQIAIRDGKALRKPFEDLLEKCEKELDDKKKEISETESKLGIINVCSYILGDQGVRMFVVNKLLALFNSRISHYLKCFKSTFSFSFNEMFEEEIKDSNDMICSYQNCSGAEMKKIDLAISFAFNDMLKYQQGVEYNVMFYDEILDSSVDSKSLEIIVNFIAQNALKEKKAVYIITHKQDIQLPQLSETIMLEKVNGFTRRI